MAQAVSHRPLASEAQVRARFSPFGIYIRQSGTGTDFSPRFRSSHANIILPNLHAHISLGDER
jgi:hypothetical protein